MRHRFHSTDNDQAEVDADRTDAAHWAGERRRRRRAHRRRHGGGPKGRRRHIDWDDVTSLERHQRDLEQREADIQARIQKVRQRIVDLSES
ncbi:MAG: hypothetical protein AAF480_14535 [Actinomycetota bacterium]